MNIKTGKVLADGIQKTQDTVDDVGIGAEDIKKGAEAINQKTGKVLADGIQKPKTQLKMWMLVLKASRRC